MKSKQLVFYVLYCLVLAAVLFAWKFPYHSLEPWLEGKARDRLGLTVDVTGLEVGLPLRLRLEKAALLGPGGAPLFVADNLEASLAIMPLLLGRASVDFLCDAYGGTMEGKAAFDSLTAPSAFEASLALSGLKLERSPALPALLKTPIAGSLSGTASLSGKPGSLADASGTVRLAVRNLALPVNSPLVRAQQVAQGILDATLKLDKRVLKVEQCQFEAKGIKGAVGGGVELRPALQESPLSLTGSSTYDTAQFGPGVALPLPVPGTPPQTKTIPFRIGGQLGAPAFSLS